MNKQTIDDLLKHTRRQLDGTIDRSLDLLDDEHARLLFLLTIYGSFLTRVAGAMMPGKKEPDAEALMTIAVIFIALTHGTEKVNNIDQDLIRHRVRHLQRSLEAIAAEWG
jgi:hypothetical protein